MFRIIIFVLLGLFSSDSTVFAISIDDQINNIVSPISDTVSNLVFFTIPTPFEGVFIPFIVLWLIISAIFFTFYFKFVNVRYFKLAVDIVRGKYTNTTKDNKEIGEVSHFQALTTALSATVGLGNIAGVAIAISIGGPGATFWMILGGFLGMSLKFVECTLGVKYRKKNKDGSISGGPMYYLKKGLKEKGHKTFGVILSSIFAVTCILGSFGGGNLFQINQATQQVIHLTGGEESFFYNNAWVFGLIMAFIIGLVIIGGIKSIARVTEKIVPLMCVLYVGAALWIILAHYMFIPSAFLIILKGAFTPVAISGGVIGVMIQGLKRAMFSNEAGVGSAAIAHSAVKTEEPVTEGLVSLLEPFIDTVVICTMTALVIIITGNYQSGSGIEGIELTSHAFASVISWFPVLLGISVILFAFSTAISWSYYGLKAITFLFGEKKSIKVFYQMLFCLFVVIGSTMGLKSVVNFSDAMIFCMSFPNIIGLYILAPVVKKELSVFIGKIEKHNTEKTSKRKFSIWPRTETPI